jgi:DNA-binding winged helix-turn-helix (wHTH) protein
VEDRSLHSYNGGTAGDNLAGDASARAGLPQSNPSRDQSDPSRSAHSRSDLPQNDPPRTDLPPNALPQNALPQNALPQSDPSQSDPSRREGLTLLFGNLEIRPDEIQALADGQRVGLTVREFQVLSVLAQREDRVVRRADIYSRVWGGEMKHRDRSVDVFVRKVRNKLAQAAPDWSYIHTHFGVGYRFAAVPLAQRTAAQTDTPPPAAATSPLPAAAT